MSITALAIEIGGACYPEKGLALFSSNFGHKFETIQQPAGFVKYMKIYRFKEFKRFIPAVMRSETLKEAGDPWWQFADYLDKFNKNRKRNVRTSLVNLIDELMCQWNPHTTKTGGLPNI